MPLRIVVIFFYADCTFIQGVTLTGICGGGTHTGDASRVDFTFAERR